MIDARMEMLAQLADSARIAGNDRIMDRCSRWLDERIANAETEPYTYIQTDGPNIFVAPDHDAIEDAILSGDMGHGDELPENGADYLEFAVISDHGNLTLYYWHDDAWVESQAWV